MDRTFTTTDGVKLHYTVSGEGEIPVVFLPGMGQGADSFASVSEKLGAEYRFYALDYRCHGASEDVEYGYHIERFAADFKEMLQGARVERFHLIAHSMGNTVAWAFFELYGQQNVISYVLEEEAPCLVADPAWSEEEEKSYCGNVLWPTFPGMPRDTVRNTFMDHLFHDHVNRDWRQELKRIQLPTLILMGTTSHYSCPPLWDWLTRNIQGSRFQALEGGHNLHVDNEAGFLAEVKPFLKQHCDKR